MAERSAIGCWIEAMRLRTLPVSVAGVVFAAGLSVAAHTVRPAALVLALVFAVLAQIASNFANEYYDYRDGLDRAGREGPRRGVTEGDITPGAMKGATFATLGLACLTGCVLVTLYGQWWMYAAGVLVALGVMAYSTGPWPLSRHGLGEVAVVVFFGIVPVCLTYMLCGGEFSARLLLTATGIGLPAANVLVVNNYRDIDDDRAVGKRTLAVMLGRRAMATLYAVNGVMTALLTYPAWDSLGHGAWTVPLIYALLNLGLTRVLCARSGRSLTPVLGMTAMLMLVFSITFLIFAILK